VGKPVSRLPIAGRGHREACGSHSFDGFLQVFQYSPSYSIVVTAPVDPEQNIFTNPSFIFDFSTILEPGG